MKTIFTFLTAVLLTVQAFAQAPEKISYQAGIRDNNGQPVTGTQVKIQISILQGSITGTVVYVETQTPTTNANGLVSLEIGAGTQVTGTFGGIDWKNGPFFIKTETDLAGGTNYTISGTSQLLSVPYALHAKTAETVVAPTYTVGPNSELGGYVFYVTPDGKHGLVVTSQDFMSGTNSVLAQWVDAFSYINFPAYLNNDGKKFTDWRLPNYYEGYLLSQKFITIGCTPGNYYWTSQEANNGTNYPYMAYSFGNSGAMLPQSKSTTSIRIRAVRSF